MSVPVNAHARLASVTQNGRGEPAPEGADAAEKRDSRTCAAVQVERRAKARRAREIGTAAMARAISAACDAHRRKQTGIAGLLDVPHQHVSQWCRGVRTVPGWVMGALHDLHPVAHAAMEATLREAFGSHHAPDEDANALVIAHDAVLSGAVALKLAMGGIDPSEADGFEGEGRQFMRIGERMVRAARAARSGPEAA